MKKEIQISSNVAIVLSLILVDVIFLIYLGYDWYSDYQINSTSQNTQEASSAIIGTAFVLALLLIALYKVYRKDRIETRRLSNAALKSPTETSHVNTAVNILIIAIGLFFGIGMLIGIFYALLFMYGTPK